MREKWLGYMEALLASRSVRAAVGQVDVHRNTAFRWRHRFVDRTRHDHPSALSDREVLLVSDAHAAYRAFARKQGIAHEVVNLRAGVRVRRGATGAIHVQNVNAYHQRFRQWLSRFPGVASRYLPNYLGWRRALDGGRVTTVEQLLRIAIGVINSQR